MLRVLKLKTFAKSHAATFHERKKGDSGAWHGYYARSSLAYPGLLARGLRRRSSASARLRANMPTDTPCIVTLPRAQDGIDEESGPSGLGSAAFEWSRLKYFSRAISLHYPTTASRPCPRSALCAHNTIQKWPQAPFSITNFSLFKLAKVRICISVFP